MRKLKVCIYISCLTGSLSCNAGLIATTVHSRANCSNNESITWWLGHPYDWRVVSIHTNIYGGSHDIDTGYAYTWRQAAVHWGEAPMKEPPDRRWYVNGYHYLESYGKGKVPFDTTYARDCDIYNGWWDN
jgi:hypothetical protein